MTCREPQRPDDQSAKQLVQVCLPEVEVCLHDDGSEPMMYDLDLRWPDGRIEALEVTRATSASLRRLLHRLGRQGTIAGTEWLVAGWFTLPPTTSTSSHEGCLRGGKDGDRAISHQPGLLPGRC
jgi:hypothetical protein